MRTNFKINFHLFDDPDIHQTIYGNMNMNWTGQKPGVGTYTDNNDLSPEMKTFYDKVLIRTAEPKLVHDQFGQKRPIPARNGKTIEFRQFGVLPKALTPLTEGITPAGQSYGVTSMTATVQQYGAYIAMTDMLELTAFDNNMAEIAKMLGSQAGRTSDTITRDIIQAGTNVIFADHGNDGNDARTDLGADDVMEVKYIKQAVNALMRQNAPTIGDNYVGIIHPDTLYDLWEDPEWVEASKYGAPTQLFTGEVGRIFGVRFVLTTEAKIWKDNTCPVISGTGESAVYRPVYGTLILGENAFGVTSINGGGIETIAKQKGSAGTADPLNQRSTMGWKLNKVAKILVQQYMVRIEHTTVRGEDVDAN